MTRTLEDIRNDENIVKNIRWDLTPEKVFAPRTVQTQDDIERLYNDQKEQAGYYFYVDVWNCCARLALMHVKADGSQEAYPVHDPCVQAVNMHRVGWQGNHSPLTEGDIPTTQPHHGLFFAPVSCSMCCRHGDIMNLRTARERVKLLKAGFTDREIEALYCTLNDMVIVYDPRQHVPALMKDSL